MAYNGFPATYQPMYYQPQYQQPMPVMQQPVQQQVPQQQQPTQPQLQPQQSYHQNGFVRVRDENEARMYPVAPGNSITFVNENAPYCYTKTVNMGQLDRPIFEKYRLVREDDGPAQPETAHKPAEAPPIDLSKYALASDLESFRAEIETIKSDLYGLAGKKKAATQKDAAGDE